jgi:hypothetical protein
MSHVYLTSLSIVLFEKLIVAQIIRAFIHQWLYSPFVGLTPLQFRNVFYIDG